ncbi:MAG: hypothetical protein ACK5JO_16385 [Halodesulfovibrio sp.]
MHCALYAAGHCLYDERLNPGYEPEWRCAELLRFMAMYDALLEQCERFSLSEEEVASLWEKRVAAARAPGDGCPTYSPRSRGCPGCRKSSCSSKNSAGDNSLLPDGNADDESGSAFPVQDFSSVLDCTHSLGSACILRMPLCEGVCARFVRQTG